MSLSAIRTEGKLFLDGVEQAPLKKDITLPADKDHGFDVTNILYSTYELEIDPQCEGVEKMRFKFLVSPGSNVVLTTESFVDKLGDVLAEVADEDLPEVVTGTDGYAGVITVSWATVTHCGFLGRCSVMMVNMTDCAVLESSFMDFAEQLQPVNTFHGLYVVHSKIAQSKISSNTIVKYSRVINSEINNDIEGKGLTALAAEIEASDIRDSLIEGCGRTDVFECHLQECVFRHSGFMRISNQRLTGIEVKADNIDLWSKFCFFTVSLPYIDIHVFTTRTDEWHMYCEDFPERSYNVDVDLPVMGEKVAKVLEAMLGAGNDSIIDSCLNYLEDSIDSRRNLLKVISNI